MIPSLTTRLQDAELPRHAPSNEISSFEDAIHKFCPAPSFNLKSWLDVGKVKNLDKEIEECSDTLNSMRSQVMQLEATLLELKRRRNEHSAIHKLPNELLGKIFMEGKHEYWESLTYHRHDNNAAWLSVIEVCTRWRDVVLNTPRFWGFIELTWNLERTWNLLHRSGSSPLHVRGEYTSMIFGDRSTEFMDVLEATLSQISRIRHLDLSLPPSFVDQLDDMMSAAMLETLCLKFTEFTPLHRLPQAMPALCRLMLANVTLTAPLPNLPRLERLSILNTSKRASVGLTWLTVSLRNAPAVVVVEVDSACLTLESGKALPSPVPLPRLSRLAFTTHFVNAHMVLDLIDHPSSTIVGYNFEEFETEAVTVFPKFTTYFSRFSDGCPSPISQVCISVDTYFQLSVFTEYSHDRPHLSISLPMPPYSDEEEMLEKCMDAFSALPLSKIPGLVLVGFSETNYYPSNILEPFKSVEVLKLSNCRAPMIRNLNTMPLLRTIIVSDYEYRQFEGEYGGMFAQLYDLLTSRQSLGTLIEKVYIENCGFPPGALKTLAQVTEVVWDGVEIPMCSLSDGGWPGMDSDTSSDSSESTTSSDWIVEFDSQ